MAGINVVKSLEQTALSFLIEAFRSSQKVLNRDDTPAEIKEVWENISKDITKLQLHQMLREEKQA